MFQSRKTMKWASLLKDIKEKVGLSPSASPLFPPSAVPTSAEDEGGDLSSQEGNGSLAEKKSSLRSSLSLYVLFLDISLNVLCISTLEDLLCSSIFFISIYSTMSSNLLVRSQFEFAK